MRHEELTVEGIKQLYLDCPNEDDKFDALVRLYGLMTIGSSIIFVRVSHYESLLWMLQSKTRQTRKTALELERRLNADEHSVACLTGDFEGGQRDFIIDSFRSGLAKVLIATNVLSRGIDVQTVSLVVNYVSHFQISSLIIKLTFPRTCLTMVAAMRTPRLIFIVSVAPDVSAAWASPSA